MTITLGYIEGISRIDTPYFASGSEQETYFTSKSVQDIETTFYPPHYRNAIHVEDTDCDINTNANYLWFTYKNKTYYYFIDSIEYSSESVIILHISMDYIQTYMFNIYVQNGVVERKHINRWNDLQINRNYLRENLSNGQFIPDVKQYNEETVVPWIVYKIKNDFKTSGSAKRSFKTRIITLNRNYDVPYFFAAIPLRMRSIIEINDINDGSIKYTFDDGWELYMQKLSPYIVDAYILPYSPFGSKAVIVGGTVLRVDSSLAYVDSSDNVKQFSETQINSRIPLITYNYDIVYSHNSDYVYFGVWQSYRRSTHLVPTDSRNTFLKNSSLNIPFAEKYIPCMLDENYIRLEYGVDAAITTYPLFKYTDISHDLLGNMDFLPDCGITVYSVTYRYANVPNDFNTYVLDTDISYYDIIIDSNSEYIANNRNRWASAGLKSLTNIASMFIAAYGGAAAYGVTAKYINTDINNIVNNKVAYDGRFSKGTEPMKLKYTRQVSSLLRKKEMNDIDFNTSMLHSIPMDTPLINQGITDNNMMYAPDNVKQIAQFSSKYTTYGLTPWYRYTLCQDYTQCAHYYHRNGYYVDEYVNAIQNVFSYVQNRYYFNILKMKDLDLHLHNVVEDEETLSGVRERLVDGVRLWRVYHASYTDSIRAIITAEEGRDFELNVPLNCVPTNLRFRGGGHPDVVIEPPYFAGGVWIVYIENNTSQDFDDILDYDVSSSRALTIGDFTYDNVELDYIGGN